MVKRDCGSRIVTLPDGRARWTTLSLEENVELVADCDRFKLLTHSNGELEETDFEAFGAQCGKFTKTICGICHDRFIIVDQKEIFWKMRRRNAHAFRRGDSAKAEPEGRTSVRGASLKDAGRLTFAAAKMGAEIIPGLLDSIRKATAERREYGKGKKAAGAKGAKWKG